MAITQKQKTKSKAVQPHSHKRAVVFGGISLLVVLIVAVQAALIWDLYRRNNLQAEEGATIKMLIARSVDGLMRDAVVEGPTNKVYFPENRLVMQATLHSPRLVYAPNDDGVQIAQKNIVNARMSGMMSGQNLHETFDRVPGLQACVRQFQIQFVAIGAAEMQQSKLAAVATKKLADGRTAYVYRDLGCTESGELVSPMIDSLQSY